MKRIVILLPLLVGLVMPLAANSAVSCAVSMEVSELPWATVDAVLKKVAETHPYSYSFLVNGYQGGTITVEQSGSSYLVTIYNEDGIADVVLVGSF